MLFRIIPIIFLGGMSLYFYTVLLRINRWRELNLNSFILFIILLLIILPAMNIFGVWFLTLLHLFEIGLLVEIINFILKKFDIKYWDIIYNSFSLPVIITIFLFSYGYYNINNIKRVEYNLTTEKNIYKSQYKIGLLSDLHFENSLDQEKLRELVEKLNKENLDILILAGDIVDEKNTLGEVQKTFKTLGKTKTLNGIYYVYGNHDTSRYRRKPNYGIEDLKEVIKKEKIVLLEDKSVEIDDNVIIVGRKDKSFKSRKTTDKLIENLDKSKYIIIADHQPVELKKNSKLGYDLQVSGHTHNGQIFPANLIIKFFNLAEFIYGNKKIEKFNIIVTSGVSGWGYPLRTAGDSEYVIINILKDKEVDYE